MHQGPSGPVCVCLRTWVDGAHEKEEKKEKIKEEEREFVGTRGQVSDANRTRMGYERVKRRARREDKKSKKKKRHTHTENSLTGKSSSRVQPRGTFVCRSLLLPIRYAQRVSSTFCLVFIYDLAS